ncbi:MAG: efflux RND transporter periplasmic adaptor subunit [Thermoguttaceae bacterium]
MNRTVITFSPRAPLLLSGVTARIMMPFDSAGRMRKLLSASLVCLHFPYIHMKRRLYKIARAVVAAGFVIVLSLVAFYFVAANVPAVRTGVGEFVHGTSLEPLVARIWPMHEDAEPVAEKSAPQAIVEVAISPTAAKNIGLYGDAIITLQPADFPKTITFPAVVAEHVGRTTIAVASPVAGIVEKIYHEAGVAVTPGEPLFDIALNQQTMIEEQNAYLALLQKRKVNQTELERIAQLDADIVPRQRRELLYAQEQIELDIALQRNILISHGLSLPMITESLDGEGQIVRTITITAPAGHKTETDEGDPLTLDSLAVTAGQKVDVGETLCNVSDLCELVIRGRAFANRETDLNKALASQSHVSAVFEGDQGKRETVNNLRLQSIANRIDTASGTLQCYVDLTNEHQIHELAGNPPRRYAQWRFKPGQRCELHVEYETLPQVFVVPADAIAHDIVETSVFAWVGMEGDDAVWRKTPVHIIHKTKDVAVIANDGAIFPGTKIAAKGASLLLAALTAANQKGSGGGGVQHGDHVH